MNNVPVEIGPYCDAVERLCGLHTLAHRFTTDGGILHGVTLPRSWFTSLLRSHPVLDKNIRYLPHFVNDMVELLRRLDSQREDYNPQAADVCQFRHNGMRLGPLYASAYIARM